MNDKQESFTEAAKPLVRWLAENGHPHHAAIVTSTNAELMEGLMGTGNLTDTEDTQL